MNFAGRDVEITSEIAGMDQRGVARDPAAHLLHALVGFDRGTQLRPRKLGQPAFVAPSKASASSASRARSWVSSGLSRPG